MREKLEQRMRELKGEFENGRKMLADLEAKQVNIKNTLMRISGAIQVLEEELAKEGKAAGSEINQGEEHESPAGEAAAH